MSGVHGRFAVRLFNRPTNIVASLPRETATRTKHDIHNNSTLSLFPPYAAIHTHARGRPRCSQAKALYASLARWNTLEVSVSVDRVTVTRLLSRSGRILSGISSNMGITLLVEREKGVLRGRARTEEEAKEANRVLKLKVRVCV